MYQKYDNLSSNHSWTPQHFFKVQINLQLIKTKSVSNEDAVVFHGKENYRKQMHRENKPGATHATWKKLVLNESRRQHNHSPCQNDFLHYYFGIWMSSTGGIVLLLSKAQKGSEIQSLLSCNFVRCQPNSSPKCCQVLITACKVNSIGSPSRERAIKEEWWSQAFQVHSLRSQSA